MPSHFYLESSPIEPWNEDSTIAWPTQDILPESYDSEGDFVDIVINDDARRFKLPSLKGVDLITYVRGNLRAQAVLCEHHNVYIEGDVSENSRIEGRDGIVSARSLQPGSEITNGSLVILENFGVSAKARNFLAPLRHDAPIILVPSGKREEVFARLAGMNRTAYRERNNLIVVLKQLYDADLLKDVIGIDSWDLEQAGIKLNAIQL